MKIFFAVLLLLLSANCFAVESKYERPCGEKILAYAGGVSVQLFSELVSRCVSINEYEERQSNRRNEENNIRESNAKTELLLLLVDTFNAKKKEGFSQEELKRWEVACFGGITDPTRKELEMMLACVNSMHK